MITSTRLRYVYIKNHISDTCLLYASVVRILLQTMFIKTSVVRSILQARVLYMRLQYFSYHRRVQAIDASVVRKILQMHVQPRPVYSPHNIDIHRSQIYIHRSHRNDIYIRSQLLISKLNLFITQYTHCLSHTVHRLFITRIFTCISQLQLYLTAPNTVHRLGTAAASYRTDRMNIYTRHFIMEDLALVAKYDYSQL